MAEGSTDQVERWPVAILAGGLATRLRPITETLPKAMVPVAGRPFIEHQLELLARNGLQRVVLCLGYLGEQVEQHIGDGGRWGIEVDYCYDGPTLLGTGGALRRALPRLGPRFFVLYGDSYLPVDYGDVGRAFARSACSGLMTVFRNEGRWDTSNVQFEQGRIVRYDKKQRVPEMRHIDYGLSILNAEVLAASPEGEILDLADVFQRLVAAETLAGFEVTERFYEIGSHSGLEELDRLLAVR